MATRKNADPEPVVAEDTNSDTEAELTDLPIDEELAADAAPTTTGEVTEETEETEDERFVRELGSHVHYAGRFERLITDEQFAEAGAPDQGTVSFSKQNHFRVALSDLTPEAQQVVAREPDFRFVE